MGQLTLVVGGVRSGKSRLAEQLAAACPPVVYLATAQAGDAEMTERIRLHRQRRPAAWTTVEEPRDVAETVARLARSEGGAGCILVECLPLWLTNLLVGLPGQDAREDGAILQEVQALAEAGRAAVGQVIVVSNEVGCGIMPVNALARRFGDLLGEANQRLAAAATAVYASVAGIPLRIK